MILYIGRRIAIAFFAGLGALWSTTEILNFLFPNMEPLLRSLYWVPVVGVALVAVGLQLRVFRIRHKLRGSDIEVEIKIGDLLAQSGNKVVGVNTNFDTYVSNSHVHPKSLHGQFIDKYFRNNVPRLDREISTALQSALVISHDSSPDGKNDRFEIGQVAQLDVSGDFLYLLAYSDFSSQWKAESTVDGLKDSIAKLWVHIFDHPVNMKPISVPVFGTNFARLGITRSDVIKDIIRSFLVVSRDKKITHKLSVVVYRKDFKHLSADWVGLNDFVKYECAR